MCTLSFHVPQCQTQLQRGGWKGVAHANQYSLTDALPRLSSLSLYLPLSLSDYLSVEPSFFSPDLLYWLSNVPLLPQVWVKLAGKNGFLSFLISFIPNCDQEPLALVISPTLLSTSITCSGPSLERLVAQAMRFQFRLQFPRKITSSVGSNGWF